MFDIEAPIYLRHIIDDLDENDPLYSDNRLNELLLVAAMRVHSEITFPQTYTVDIDARSISPDPTEGSSRDENFLALTCMKAACILARSELKTASSQAIAWKEGSSSVDRRGFEKAKQLVAQEFCKEYEDSKYSYQVNNVNVGVAILSPFKIAQNSLPNAYYPYPAGSYRFNNPL